MIDRFEIIDHDSPRPEAERILYCDRTGGDLFRDETDLDLSHWQPNPTCRVPSGHVHGNLLPLHGQSQPGTWMVAVNNHVDVDGILSHRNSGDFPVGPSLTEPDGVGDPFERLSRTSRSAELSLGGRFLHGPGGVLDRKDVTNL
jgi:hypothetical protein